MTEKQEKLWILGISASAGFSLGSAVMGIIETIKDRRLERKLDRIEGAQRFDYNEAEKRHFDLMEQFKRWKEENEQLLQQALQQSEET